jgi:hypothetical protein
VSESLSMILPNHLLQSQFRYCVFINDANKKQSNNKHFDDFFIIIIIIDVNDDVSDNSGKQEEDNINESITTRKKVKQTNQIESIELTKHAKQQQTTTVTTALQCKIILIIHFNNVRCGKVAIRTNGTSCYRYFLCLIDTS